MIDRSSDRSRQPRKGGGIRTDSVGDRKFAKADSTLLSKVQRHERKSDEGYTHGALFKSAEPPLSTFSTLFFSYLFESKCTLASTTSSPSPLSFRTSLSYRISAAYWKSIGPSWHRASLPLSTRR